MRLVLYRLYLILCVSVMHLSLCGSRGIIFTFGESPAPFFYRRLCGICVIRLFFSLGLCGVDVDG
jgi:hypothetical protein